MGASRKLQGEIDRVLKKVQEGVDVFDGIWNKVYDTENANQKEKFEADLKKEIKKLQRYRDQIKTWIQSSEIKDKKALMDARKLIEREMERFKVCEKETKTKAFSKEGLGQQPKTDPKEKAKTETRDWLNNVVGDLESQIDNFEAEVEGLSVKKGKTRPPRLIHLDSSITRHKAHILKLELILRLLDNDQLSPEQVNDIKDFLEDYVERNQEDFDEFGDVEVLYSSLPLDVEGIDDLVSLAPSGFVKAAMSSTTQHVASQDQSDETTSQESNSDVAPRTPSIKNGHFGSLVSSPSPSLISGTPGGPNTAPAPSASVRPLAGGPTTASIISSLAASVRVNSENAAAVVAPFLVSPSSSVKDEDNFFPARKPSPAIVDIALGRGIGRGVPGSLIGAHANLSSSAIASDGAIGSVPTASDVRNILGTDERLGSGGLTPQVVSPLNNRMILQQVGKTNEGVPSNDSGSIVDGSSVGGRPFSSSVVSGVQWRPQSASPFLTQSETVRGRPEIAPDQREKFLQKLQQVQQVHGNILGGPILPGANHKQFPSPQQNLLLQQINSQNSSLSLTSGMGLAPQGSGLSSVSSVTPQQQIPAHQPSSQHPLFSSGPKDTDEQQLQIFGDDLNSDTSTNSGLAKVMNDDDPKAPYVVANSPSATEGVELPRDSDLSPGLLLQPSQAPASLGVIGRRSISDLGAIGDNISGSAGNSGGIMFDQNYNLLLLEAAFNKLPMPKDSERLKSYVPRHPAIVPASYPQVQFPIIESPSFWERMGSDPVGTDTLFFAFYHQQNSFQQFLAARELKRQSWRFHRKYNTWFQRHEEPKITTDEFEKGTYVYFDFHFPDDISQQGWCQRIKTEFTFEYNYLEDELIV